MPGPEALAAQDCLVYALPGLRERWSFRTEDGPMRVAVQGRFACSSPLGLRRAALCGLGPALLADWLIEGDLAAGRMADLFPGVTGAPSRLDGGIWLVRAGPASAPTPRRVQAAARALTEALTEEEG